MMRNKKVLLATIGLGLAVAATTAFAGLNNPSNTVRMVDVAEGGTVFVHLGSSMVSRPGCTAISNIVACSLDDSYCEPAMRIALSAKLAEKNIEFSVDGNCVGSVARFNRLRIKE